MDMGYSMMKISTKVAAALIIVISFASMAYANRLDWPLRGQIDLSSGFGDFRQTHFHFGVDLRTGGLVGKSLFSPVDGYVYRARTSYFGYGKALYIKGDDGHIYVYGHLLDFAPKVDSLVKRAQVATHRYFQDLELLDDSLRVKKGEFIAYTGQSGAGAPHVQFEVRSPDNIPLNPLQHGFTFRDTVRPVFSRIGFQLRDERSLFDTGTRKMFFEVVPGKKAGVYVLDTVLYFHRPFGMLVDCFDRMRRGGMKQAVYSLSLYLDDELFYQVVFDSADFDVTQVVRLEYDYEEAVDGRKFVRTLFKKPGNVYTGSRGVKNKSGIIGQGGHMKSFSIGKHTARIVAQDCFGNSATLTFDFLWGPPENIYRFDSTTTVSADLHRYYFTPTVSTERLAIDSVKVFLNRGELWGPLKKSTVRLLEDGTLVCEIKGKRISTAVLRLFLFAAGKGLIRDNLFNGIVEKTGRPSMEYEILEDGLLITVNAATRKGTSSRVELYYRGKLLGIEYPTYFNMAKHLCFIPPKKEYNRIDVIKAFLSTDTSYKAGSVDSVDIVLVGDEDNEEVAADDYFSAFFSQETFYEPRYIEIKAMPLLNRAVLRLNSNAYQIFPKVFVWRKEFEIRLKIPSTNVSNHLSGICWLDEEANKWVWLEDNVFSEHVLTAHSQGGGTFAAVFDYDAPKLKYLTVSDGRIYRNLQPAINFVIEDTLSGIGSDTAIVIKLDGQWLIPEYDPETGQCRSKPLEPLKPGRHHLGIRVTDRAGNLTEKYLNFTVQEPRKKKQR